MTSPLQKDTITASGEVHPVKAQFRYAAAHGILGGDRVRAALHLTGLSIALLATVCFSLMVGRYHVPFSTWWQMLTAPDSGVARTVLLAVRLPRIVAGVLIGGGLAAAGAAYQGLFRNPIVSPDILGASAGAGFGAAIAILLSFNVFAAQLASFLWGLLAVMLTYSIASSMRGGGDPVLASFRRETHNYLIIQ